MSDFMVVERVATEHGSHIEPPFDESWDDLQKLQWSAAVTCVDGGFAPGHVRVFAGGLLRRRGFRRRAVPVPGWYSINVGSLSMAAYRYDEAYDVLHGIAVGAPKARRG